MQVFGILTIILLYKHDESVANGSVRPLESDELSELYQKERKKPSVIKNK